MRSIFVGSTGGAPGQTLAVWALGLVLMERGLKVGFFKPYGLLPDLGPSADDQLCDPDVVLLKNALHLTEPEEYLCPVMLTENLVPEISGSPQEEMIARIQAAFERVSAGKDVVLIMGAKEIFFDGGVSGVPDSLLVKLFDATVLLIDRYQRDNMTFYSLLSLNSFLDGRVKSAVVNYVPADKWEHVRSKVIPFLKEKGLKSVVAVPQNPTLGAFQVSTIAEFIDGRVLCCPERIDNLIESFTIGSKYLEGSLSLFKQVYNKIVLVGLAPSEDSPAAIGGIILTGGKAPSDLVLRVSGENSIPLILTRRDTFQTMERLEQARPLLGRKDEFKVRKFIQLMDGGGASQWVDALL